MHSHHAPIVLFTLIAAAITTAACSDTDNSSNTSSGHYVANYDSTYSAAYDLYIIDDDTAAYEIIDYDGPLNEQELAIEQQLDDYAGEMLVEYDSDDGDNTVISPTSASMLYGLMGNFVEEQSDNAFMDAMGLEQANSDDVNSFFRKFINKKGKGQAAAGNETKSRLAYASNLWMDNNTSVYKSFLAKSRFYGFGVKGMAIDEPEALRTINNSIGSIVGSLDGGLPSSLLQAKAKCIVTSSMTFEGKWLYTMTLDKSMTHVFTNSDGTATACQVIRTSASRRHHVFPTFDMVELPYKDNAFSMYVILPHETKGLNMSLAELNKRGLKRCMDIVSDTTRTHSAVYYTPRDTTYTVNGFIHLDGTAPETATITVIDTLISDTIFDIRIPKVNLSSTTSLNPDRTTSAKATKRMYQTNLPKVAPAGFKLTNVFQSCRLIIDEKGTMAQSKDSLAVVTDEKNTGIIPVVNTITNSIITNSSIRDQNAVPTGRKTHETVIVPFYVSQPFAIFIREKQIGTIPFACTIRDIRNNK